MLRLTETDKKQLGLLLTPSWLSALLAISAGLIVAIGVIIAFSLQNSEVQQQLTAWQLNKPQRALTTPDQILAANDNPSLEETWPLVIIWAIVGLVVYLVAAGIVRSLGRAEELRESLEYVHAKPDDLLRDSVQHAVFRAVSALLLILLFWLILEKVLPYAITAAHAAASDVLSLTGFLYSLLSFAVVVISLHLAAILCRLTLGRVRIFTG